MVEREQIFGLRTTDSTGEILGVYTFRGEGVSTEILHGKNKVIIPYLRTAEDLKKDRGLESLKIHVYEINNYLKIFKSDKVIDLEDFMACIISQLL